MTNREWLLNKMQNMSDEDIVQEICLYEYVCKLKECKDINCGSSKCREKLMDWLKSEYKEPITLSEAERVILENINKEYSYIARNQNGDLEVFFGKPFKATVIWNSRGFKYCYLTCFNHLFQFITWEDEQPYNIAELLEEK